MLGLHADEFGGSKHSLLDLGLAELHIFRAEGYILENCLLKELILRVLEAKADLEAGVSQSLLIFPDIRAVNEYLARVGLQKAVEMGYQGAFARACVADNAHKLALLYSQVDVIDRGDLLNGAL